MATGRTTRAKVADEPMAAIDELAETGVTPEIAIVSGAPIDRAAGLDAELGIERETNRTRFHITR